MTVVGMTVVGRRGKLDPQELLVRLGLPCISKPQKRMSHCSTWAHKGRREQLGLPDHKAQPVQQRISQRMTRAKTHRMLRLRTWTTTLKGCRAIRGRLPLHLAMGFQIPALLPPSHRRATLPRRQLMEISTVARLLVEHSLRTTEARHTSAYTGRRTRHCLTRFRWL